MTEAQPEQPLSLEQQETARLLDRLFGKTFADRYADFCVLVSGQPDLHASRPLAAHAMREFESWLRDALVGPMEAEILLSEAEDERLGAAGICLRSLGFAPEMTERALKNLRPRRNHADQIRAIALRLGFAADSVVTLAWISLNRMAGRAHERSFHEELAIDQAFRDEFQRPFELVVRSVVLALQGKYSAFMLRVNELAAMSNAGKALSLFEAEIPGAPTLQWHFFQTIDGPRWLKPLLRSRFVLEPQLQLSEPGRGLRTRQWPVAAYLRRMAASNDASIRAGVADVIRKVATSQNPDLRDQGIEIVAALPTPEAAALTDVLVGWLDQRLHHGFFETPVKVLKAFAAEGNSDSAFALARAIFRVFEEGGSIGTLHAENMYEHYLPQAVTALSALKSKVTVALFSDLLTQAARIEGKFDEARDGTGYTAHPLSESQMATYGVYESLVIAVRNAAYLVAEQTPSDVSDVVTSLFNRGPRIFKRLALQVLSRYAAQAPKLAAQYLSDKDLIGKTWCENEYAALAQAWFPRLGSERQQAILAIIDAMPKQYSWWPDRFQEHEGRPPDAEDMRRFNASVIRDATWRWRDALPTPRRQALDAIVAEIGDPDDWRKRAFRESVSPMSGDDFAVRSIPDIVDFLRTWRPQTEPVRQTIGALGQQLRRAVEQNPTRFIENAAEFTSLRPIYIRRILEGLANAPWKPNGLTWDAALPLIENVVSWVGQPIDSVNLHEGDDKDWQWAAAAAVDLLKTLVRRGDKSISNDQAPRIVEIIETLAKVAPKSPTEENFEEEYRKHQAFMAQQTLRGSVTELCMLFLYWVAQREGSPLALAPRTAMERFSQIETILNAELSDVSRNGRIPRAVLGRYLRNAHYFGEGWLRTHLQQLFPPDNSELRDAAWSGHLLYDAGPLAPVMGSLEQSYKDEIDRLSPRDDHEEQKQRSNRLSEYLVILFIDGTASLELLQSFWQAASDRVRQHAMWFLGRQLLASKEMSDGERTRALSYWEMRLSAGMAANDKNPFNKEIGAIGQWMQPAGLDEEWVAAQLLRVVRAGFAPANGYLVVEWLGKRAPTDPDRVVETLAALLSIPNLEPWVYVTYPDSVRAVLSEGREKGSPATVALVNETISRLASFGEARYLDLLTPDA